MHDMTEYQFHPWSSRSEQTTIPSVNIAAPSHLHGSALALRQFAELGCDITSPLAHVDMTETDGTRHTLLVEEVLDWLNDPRQTYFVHHECLEILLREWNVKENARGTDRRTPRSDGSFPSE